MTLLATNRFAGDGATTSYEINFVGQYIAPEHVKAYREDNTTKVRTPITITPGQWLNATTLQGFAPTPVGQTLVIYRDTPKPPLVDFVNGSRLTEYNLDLVARQGLFSAAEALDVGTLALESAIATGGDAAAALSLAGAAMAQAEDAVDTANAASSAASSAFGIASGASVAAGQAALQAGQALTVANAAQETAEQAIDLVESAVAGSVASFNGRHGAVMPQAGDYTKAQVGLGNVDNTADTDKPVSSATATALAGKADADGSNATGVWGVDTTGNAATATKLATPRMINGVAFDGSQDIEIAGGGGGVAGVSSFNGRSGTVLPQTGDYTKAQVGLGNVDNTSDTDKPVSTAQATAISAAVVNLVEKEAGKGLSSNDYTTADKNKLAGVAVNATANATDASLRDRSTHTGTQAMSTVEGLPAALAGKLGTSDTATNATRWAGGAKYVSTAAPSGGVDGDVWFERVA